MNDIYDKLTRFCLYRERCTTEVIQKLYELKVKENEQKKIISQLKEEKYLNDERYIKAYIHTKIYIKKWGKIKIKQELSLKKLDKEMVKKELILVDDEIYIDNLNYLAERKWPSLSKKTYREKKSSLFRYLSGKGYESDLVMDWLKNNDKT